MKNKIIKERRHPVDASPNTGSPERSPAGHPFIQRDDETSVTIE
jgi:hypothetical protein